ncbi:response regulator transcription factor [soil metagenome]
MRAPETPPPAETAISVWLIEDNHTFRRTVRRVIEQSEGMACPHDFSTCEKALAALRRETKPEVILLDVGLPGMDGIQGIREIKVIDPAIHVIILTVFDDQSKVLKAICAGASGYLLKTSPAQEIIHGIREVMDGGAPMNGRVARLILSMFSRLAPRGAETYGLTERETEILKLMVKGLIKKEIADQLAISFHTVDSHLRNIYTKLHVNTQTGAVAKAIREGIVR